MEKMISVIMSVYNTDEVWLRESIESILNQTYADFEFIIITDKPTDGSEKIVNEYAEKDERIILLRNEENYGLTKSLNKGLAIAKGKYIARMDADDVSLLSRFKTQLEFMEKNPDVAVVGSRVYCPGTKETVQYEFTDDMELLKIRMLFRNAGIPHPTAFMRRDFLCSHKIMYTERMKKSQDYKLWLDICSYGKMAMLPDVLLMYRIHDGQISADKKNQNNYAHMVTLEQAELLLGELTEDEKILHLTAADEELPNEDAVGLSKYFGKILEENKKKKLYKQELLKKELRYMWCRKVLRRVFMYQKFDMVLHIRTLSFFDPRVIVSFIRMAHNKRDYQAGIVRNQRERMT